MVQGEHGNITENILAYAYGDSKHGFSTTRMIMSGTGDGQQENVATNFKNKVIGGILNKVKDAKDALTGSKSVA